MKTRVIAHGTGVVMYDRSGRRTAFNYKASQRPEQRRRHSDSESALRASSSALASPIVIRAFNDDGTRGLAVLPPDFSL